MKCGLLGRKLSHSYSPIIHQAFGGYSYTLFEVESPELAAFLERGDFDGINVTIPYKQDVIPFCRQLSAAAEKIGSVNALVRLPGGGFFGDNTDAAGFKKLIDESGLSVRGKKVVVLGKGGSSLTVRYVLNELGAGEVVTVSRHDNNADFLSRHRDAAILVNSTPVGQYPDTEAAPVSLEHFPALEGVLDLIYNPARTRLLMDAGQRGLSCAGGLTMLVGQAAAVWELFTSGTMEAGKEQEVLRMLRRRMENIVLVGMPGCGKSTIGHLLSEKLGKRFVDTDAEVAQAAGCSIPEIFAEEGESGFRLREAEVIKKFGRESGLILATGGGCVTREENYRHLRQNGSIVFIDRPLDELAREGRPLSQGDLEAMYAQRLPLYRRFAGCMVFNGGGIAALDAAQILIRILAQGELDETAGH